MPDAPLLTPLRANQGDAAVVFVHGFGGNPQATWQKFPDLLAADERLKNWDLYSLGYQTKLVPDIVGIWSANAPLETLALLLYSSTSLVPLKNYRSLALIAHSMGGLVTQRAIIDHPDLALRTSHVFLFGTPSNGLAKAGPFSFLKRQARDMGQHSVFITDLRSRWAANFSTHSPFRFWTIAGEQDEFVPADSSLGPFPLEQRLAVPGNHIQIVKPDTATHLSVQAVVNGLLGDAAPAGPWNAARVAVESRRFEQAVELLYPHRDQLDQAGLVELALALDKTGRQSEAITILEQFAGDNTDAMGVLAGRLKRRWLREHRRADVERARELYQKAFELSRAKGNAQQSFYHGINLAFLELAYGFDQEAAQSKARDVLAFCAQAPRDQWRLATEGEAHLILGETEAALASYRAAVAEEPEPRELESMYQQALRIADLMRDDQAEGELDIIFRSASKAPTS